MCSGRLGGIGAVGVVIRTVGMVPKGCATVYSPLRVERSLSRGADEQAQPHVCSLGYELASVRSAERCRHLTP